LLHVKIVDEIHVMRKTIIDGSNVSGFQRTMLVGLNGYLETSFGRVGIGSVCLEEDSARIIDHDKAIFRLDRLGMPEVEISTKPDIHTPEQALEAAEALGNILKSTGKVKVGLGVVRQDVNVSIKNGARTEIKHVQRLSQIPIVVVKEVERQVELIKKGQKVENSVRVAREDGSTAFLRPLPGAARMYVETDVYPILVDKGLLEKIRKNLPESLDEKMKRYVNDYKLSQEVAKQLVNEKWQLFERAVSMQVDASLAASVLTNVLKDLARKGIDVDSMEEEVLRTLLAYKDGKIGKEAIPMLLENVKPGEDIDRLIERLRLRRISREELEEIVERKMRESGIKDGSGYKVLMGLVMAEVRGRIDGAVVNEVVRKKLGL